MEGPLLIPRVVAVLALLSFFPLPGHASSSFTRATMIAFTSQDLWDLDAGFTLRRLGTRPETIYLIGRVRPYGDVVRLPPGALAQKASLSPSGDLLAYVGSTGEPSLQGVLGVAIADTAGRSVSFFPGAANCAWNPSGSRLAVAYAPADSGQLGVRAGIVIWTRGDSLLTRLEPVAETMAWGSGDTLLAGRYWGILAIATTTGEISRSGHRGVHVSPDGRFSIVQRPGAWPVQIWEDAPGAERLACCWRLLADVLTPSATPDSRRTSTRKKPGTARARFVGKMSLPPPAPVEAVLGSISHPFWIRTPGADHLLVLNSSYPGPRPAGPRVPDPGRTVILDVDREAVLAVFAGRAIGMTADQRGILVLRPTDNLAIEEVVPVVQAARRAQEETPDGPSATLIVETVQIDRWRRFEDRVPLGSASRLVRAGSWLPGLLPGEGPCDRVFHVLEVGPSERARIAFDPKRFSLVRSGETAVSAEEMERGEIEIPREGIVFEVGARNEPPRWAAPPVSTRFEIIVRSAP